MEQAPPQDFGAVWRSLPPDQRETIGALALGEAFQRFAASDLVGDEHGQGVRYLTKSGQRRAEREADDIGERLTAAIHGALPRLFGDNPSAEHPNGTDPPWANPITFRVRSPSRRAS